MWSTTILFDDNITTEYKNILKVVDVLGKETKEKRNTPLLYIYDDGTIEKKIIVE